MGGKQNNNLWRDDTEMHSKCFESIGERYCYRLSVGVLGKFMC